MTASSLQSLGRPDATGPSLRLQRKCACGATARGDDTCEDCKRKLQRKLSIGSVDDPLEEEADRIADRVVAARASDASGTTPVHVQRAGGGSTTTEAVPSSVERTLAGSGRPMEAAVREDMARRFGHDFFDVRVHDDPEAATSARDVQAHAYAVGTHLVFDTGRYAPHTSEGRRLLAHELTHVLQQAQAPAQAARQVRRGGLFGPSPKPRHCSGWTCGEREGCRIPDDKPAPNATPSTSWTLVANIDTDVKASTDIRTQSDFGHAFVAFEESNGDRYTYGHYASKLQLPTEMKPEVPGCVAHPDRTHRDCVDLSVPYTLTKAEYDQALAFAQLWCEARSPYNLVNSNCTTFVEHVVKKAGKSIPSSRGPVSLGKVQADNPNTLLDAHLSQADADAWRQRVTGTFAGSYDYGTPATAITFIDFKLKTDALNAVAGKYSYTGSAGNKVEGTLDGRLTFQVDPSSKAVTATVKFDWKEPSGTGKGNWSVSASGKLDGTWGRGNAESGMGAWTLAKQP